jgi:hypothetical protein
LHWIRDQVSWNILPRLKISMCWPGKFSSHGVSIRPYYSHLFVKCDINISKQMSDCLFKLSNCFQLFCRFTNKNYWQYAWADREVWIFPIILRAGHWKGLFLDLKLAQVLGFYVCIYSHLKRRQIHPSWVAIWLYILNSYFIYTGNDFLRFSDGIKLWYNKTS